MRCKELSEYLENLKASKRVWISEDATAITAKVSYDPFTNQLIGITLPISTKDGCPIPLSYKAENEEKIREHLKLSRSKSVYVVIAQALNEEIPPFVLQIFGTNSEFKSTDVIKRWQTTKAELNKYILCIQTYILTSILRILNFIGIFPPIRFGIEVVGISSDGDPKLLAAMTYQLTNFPVPGMVVTQDTTHIATKLRNRLLKPDIHLPMGSFRVTVEHLLSLIKNVQKSVHGLTRSDVCPTDKMNYDSANKIMDDRTISALQKYVNNSEATVRYLKICHDVTSSFLQLEMKPLERVFRIWRATYFLRIWRQQIVSSKTFKLQENFISSNAFTCIEINSRNLIVLIKKFRDEGSSEQFLTSLFDSQNCERAFRQLRSMGTVQYTKINFSLYELIHMIGRIETQNDIAYVKLANEPISFPNKREGKAVIYPLPTDEEIEATLMEAKNEAIRDAEGLGMIEFANIDDFQIKSNLQVSEDGSDECSDEQSEFVTTEGRVENVDEFEPHESSDIGPNFETDGNNDTLDDTAFTTILDENGTERLIRKSTLVWMLTDSSTKLSNDRIRRFKKKNRKNKNKLDSSKNAEHFVVNKLVYSKK